MINESGLYSVILRSQKEEAKTFKRWVTHEVLPSIRKTGYYAKEQEKPLSFEDVFPKESPFLNVHSGLLGKLMQFPKGVAEVYLMDCGVTPEYIAYRKNQDIQLKATLQAQIEPPKPEPIHIAVLVVRFVADWQSGLLGAPFIPCLGQQVQHLFAIWCPKDQPYCDTSEVMKELYLHPALYRKKTCIDKAENNHRVMTMINGQKPADGQSFYEYVTQSIIKMDDFLSI